MLVLGPEVNVASEWLMAIEMSLLTISKLIKIFLLAIFYYIWFTISPYSVHHAQLRFISDVKLHPHFPPCFCLCVNWRRRGQRLEEISFITCTRLPCSFIFSISFAIWPWEKLTVRSKYFLLICRCSVSSCCKSLFKHNYSIPFKRRL